MMSMANTLCKMVAVAMLALSLATRVDAVVEQKPTRVASTHLCTDQLLMLLAEPEHIVSVSHFASNPDMSMMAEAAEIHPVNHGLAEELVLKKPDLILTSQFGSPGVLILKSLGYRVISIPVALTLDDIRVNIQTVAEALGEPVRGTELIRKFNEDLRQAVAPYQEPRPTIVIYEANGYTTGKRTLRSEILELAGFINLAAQLGISSSQYLPLEALVMHPLDALMTAADAEKNSLAYEVPNHPALRTVFRDVPKVNIPGKVWICGTPFVTQALRQLTEFRNAEVGIGK